MESKVILTKGKLKVGVLCGECFQLWLKNNTPKPGTTIKPLTKPKLCNWCKK